MSSMSGSEIARLVLGYLQSQRMDGVAVEFCKLSPYLREEYSILKRGLRIKQINKPRTLLDIIKEYIEIEETVTEYFDNELNQHEQIPNELLSVHTLKDKVQYACRVFGKMDSDEPIQSQTTSFSRKRTNVCAMEYDSDSTMMSSPGATKVQDLPGYTRPIKRRKIYDPNLIITNKCEAPRQDDNKMVKGTTFGSSSSQDANLNKYLQMSASKAKQLSESMLASNFPNLIAQSINNAFENSNISIDQLQDKLAGIVTEQFPTFEDIIQEVCSESYIPSSSDASKPPSEPECEFIGTHDNRLHTPVPNDSLRCNRYELRSNRKSGSLNISSESKRKKNSKAEIISDERIDFLPESAMQVHRDEPIVLESDSEGTVTTTSQPQYQPVGPQTCCLVYDKNSQTYYILPAMPNGSNFDTQSQPSTSQAASNMTLPTNIIDQSQFTISSDQSNNKILGLDNYTIINSNNLQSNQISLSSESKQETILNNAAQSCDRIIVINDDEVNKEGLQPVTNELAQNQLLNSQLPAIEAQLPPIPEQSRKSQEGSEQSNGSTLSNILKEANEPKVVTPKQQIRTNNPSASKSLSTPRSRNPHVRVLDFNTPNRLRLSQIPEMFNESMSNRSRFFAETPQNRSILSTQPSSAPPKVNTVEQRNKKSIERTTEVTSDAFVPVDENTVISVEGETPKVRKSNRNSCVRTISACKEISHEENQKRMKRVAQTKKKICPDESPDSNESGASNKKDEVVAPPSSEDAMTEWQKIRSASINPSLFEQNLREQNSQKQKSVVITGRKKRICRPKKKAAVKTKPAVKSKPAAKSNPAVKNALDQSTKSADISMNSSIDTEMNSTLTRLEAQMLEENLKSAKKMTPIKQSIVQKSAKKKTPIGILKIKLTPSPRNKSVKRQKSAKKELTSAHVTKELQKKDETVIGTTENAVRNSVAEGVVAGDSQTSDQLVTMVSENTTDDLEVAENLIRMQEVILHQENVRKSAQKFSIDVLFSQHALGMSTSKNNNGNMIAHELLRSISKKNMSMSCLLETPYKCEDGLLFPRTPGLNALLPPQLITPMLRSAEYATLLEDSIFKNPQFPTPAFPITHGSIFTPLKDINSPRSDQDTIYGAINRPTDYSSSSSYYKPDESDGIDKQIQAMSTRKNSGVYSADEIEMTKNTTTDTTQNTLNTSSSSTSSSGSSDSDSDSDTSSSSDSDASMVETPATIVELNQEHQPNFIDEDSTQIIKSHLVITNGVNIAQNILLPKPEEPMVNKEAERNALLEEKRRRIQESLRQDEMKKHEKFKPKPTKKYRSITDVKRDRFRAPIVVASPSKRKSTQPKKIVSVHPEQMYAQIVNDVNASEMNVQSVTTERLITEAAGDNAIADASDVTTTQNARNSPKNDEESIEAIECHINKGPEANENNTQGNKKAVAPKKMSPKNVSGLIDMLSEKQKKLDANRPKMKAEVIPALPMPRNTRSRARIRPVQIIPKQTVPTTSSKADSSENKRISKNADTNKAAAKSTQKSKAATTKIDSNSKIDSTKSETPTNESVNADPSKIDSTEQGKIQTEMAAPSNPEPSIETSKKSLDKYVTPAKERRLKQIRDIFGDCTDIETPIKSPPRCQIKIKTSEGNESESKETEMEHEPTEKKESQNTKFEADSSNVNDDSEDDNGSSDSDSDEDTYEMVSIDENDKKRFISIRENASVKSKGTMNYITIGTKNVVLPNDVKIVLEPSDEMELYIRDVNSVAEMKKGKQQRCGVEVTKSDTCNEPSSSSENFYGKPLHTSTPSPSKTITPKITIKHKTGTVLSPKKQSITKGENFFNGIQIDDVLVQLHPTTE